VEKASPLRVWISAWLRAAAPLRLQHGAAIEAPGHCDELPVADIAPFAPLPELICINYTFRFSADCGGMLGGATPSIAIVQLQSC
jgi:hypothetical protein